MTNQEMLQLASLAVGYKYLREHEDGGSIVRVPGATIHWNPLEDDGEALRLAVNLCIEVKFCDGFKQVICRRNDDKDSFEIQGIVGYGYGADKEPTCDNVRLAITRAAAEIGRRLKEQQK